jgi:uroporphyrin-III C-methyltransferase
VSGIVYLVGAGPGDPRLLTLRGAEVLQRADVVVYDRLAPAALLDLAPRGAERVDAGKARGRVALTQEEINRVLVDRGRRGLVVVRLKGGDPFVFGRGGEEALALAEAGVAFEVVPGVSAAVAAPAYAGIPVTHRGLATSYAVVSATLAGGAPGELARTAAAADTLVLLMAAERLGEVCGQLIAAGRPADQPAAVIASASTAAQRVLSWPSTRSTSTPPPPWSAAPRSPWPGRWPGSPPPPSPAPPRSAARPAERVGRGQRFGPATRPVAAFRGEASGRRPLIL